MVPGSVDWAGLPSELLQLIAGKLADVADYVRYRAVCVPWRRSARPGNLPPQVPWLLLPSDPATEDRRFYSIAEDRVYTLHLPEARGKRIQGSSHGWVLALDDTLSPSLFNPLTRARIQLPPLISGTGSDDKDYAIPFSRGQSREHLVAFYRGAILTSSPTSSSDYLVMSSFVFCPNPGFAFYRPGDTAWTTVDRVLLGDFSYYKGKFITVSNYSRASAIDAGTLAKAPMAMPSAVMSGLDRLYLVVSSSEELLMVRRHGEPRRTFYGTPRFEVFQLDRSEQPKWFEVKNIGDSMLFLDADHALFVDASGLTGLRRNCIYFLDADHLGNTIFGGPELCRISMFNIGDGSVEYLPFHWNHFPKAWWEATWVAPSLC